MPRTRSIIVGLLGFAAYLALNLDILQRGLVEFDDTWLWGLGVAILVSAWALEGQGPAVRLFWVALAPVLGSMVGYGLPVLTDYMANGYLRSGSLSQWTRMAAIQPYLPARLWMLSALLLILSIVNHQLLSLRNRAAAEGRRP
jgi:hypothetical protein